MANYTYLVNDIIEASENDGTEFVSYIPKMVNRVEERLTKTLDDYGLVTATSVSLPTNQNLLTLPTGTLIIKNIHIKDEGTKIALLQRTDEFINDYWPVSASTGTPKYYARKTNSQILFAPTASATYGGSIVYTVKPSALTSTNQTNYYTDYCYDALFYGSMVEAMDFMKNYTVSNVYSQRYENAVELLRNQSKRTRRDDMEVNASPAGGDNTINGGT
tara:strand:+ start:28 stop:681 length:654 start_codon:yes stop_codon:yes gene_type:complete